MRSSARKTSEKAPSNCSKASRKAPGRVRSRDRATRCNTTSVSLVAWKMEPSLFEFPPQFARIGDIAIVGNSDLTLIAGHGKRLGIQKHCVARRGITCVSDRQFAWQFVQYVGVKISATWPIWRTQ